MEKLRAKLLISKNKKASKIVYLLNANSFFAETYALLVKVAESLAEALAATILIEAVQESANRLRITFVHTSDEEETEGDFVVHYESDHQKQPTFAITHETYQVKPHENVTIHARINGSACHTIEWYKDNVRVEANE